MAEEMCPRCKSTGVDPSPFYDDVTPCYLCKGEKVVSADRAKEYGKVKWPSMEHVVLVVDDADSKETQEAIRLLEGVTVNYEIEDNGVPKHPADGVLPWLITVSGGAFGGVDQIRWYCDTFGRTALAY